MGQRAALEGILVVDCPPPGPDPADDIALVLCQLLSGARAQVVRFLEDSGAVDADCRTRRGHGRWRVPREDERDALLSAADVVLVRGGATLLGVPSSAVIVDIDEGDLVDHALPVRSHELVAQAVTGAVFEHVQGRPAVNGMRFGLYGAAINGATAVVAALIDRLDSGAGQRLRLSRCLGVVGFMGMVWGETADGGAKGHGPIPVGADVPLFACADGEYVCLSSSPRCPNPLAVLREILELEIPAESLRGTRDPGDLVNYYYNYDVVAAAFRRFPSAEVVARLRAADFAVERVRTPFDGRHAAEAIRRGSVSRCADCGAEYVDVERAQA